MYEVTDIDEKIYEAYRRKVESKSQEFNRSRLLFSYNHFK